MSYSKKYNPFKPNHPINPGMFSGRANEIIRINDTLLQLKNGNPTNLLIIGERGIGKSSLLILTNYLAIGKIDWEEDLTFNFLSLQFNLDPKITIIDLIKKINNGLQRELAKEEKEIEFFKNAWSFIKKLEIAGCKINDETSNFSESEIFDNFVYSLADTINTFSSNSILTQKGFKTKKDGLIILLDEVDNVSEQLNLGTFIKNLSEALIVQGCYNIMFVLSGLPKVRDILQSSHESSVRIFEEITLYPLKSDDVKDIYLKGIKEVNKNISPEIIKIEKNGLEIMIDVSEGYPHFAQQIGSSVFNLNEDLIISDQTVKESIFGTNGAIDLIGRRFYSHLYYNKIKEDSYREILQIMAENPNEWIRKKEIQSKYTKKSTTLTNGLKALRDRNIIISQVGKKGVYKLQWIGFGIWIKYLSEKVKNYNL